MKIGDLRQGRVQAAQTLGPNAALQELQTQQGLIRDVTGSVAKLADTLGKKQAESQINVVNAKTRERVNEYIKAYGDGRPASLKEIKQFADVEAIKQHPDYDPNSDVVPAHVWFASGLEGVMTKATEEFGTGISNPGARREWESGVKEAQGKAIQAAYVQSGEMAVKYNYDRVDAERKAAIEREDYGTALELIENPVYAGLSQSERDYMRQDVMTKEEVSGWQVQIMSPDESIVQGALDGLTSPEYSGMLTTTKRKELAYSANAQLKAIDAAEDDAEEARQERNAVELEYKLDAGITDLGDIKLAYDKGDIGFQQYRNLSSLKRSSDAGGTSNYAGDRELWQVKMARDIAAIELGLDDYTVEPGEALPSMDERIATLKQELYDGVLVAGVNGSPDLTRASRSEFDALKTSIDKLEDINRDATLYTDLVNDLSLRIEGYRYDERQARISKDKDASVRFADALRSLNRAVDGVSPSDLPEAVQTWKDTQYIQFMNAELTAVMAGLSDSEKSISPFLQQSQFTDGDGKVYFDPAGVTDLISAKLSKVRVAAGNDMENEQYKNAASRAENQILVLERLQRDKPFLFKGSSVSGEQ